MKSLMSHPPKKILKSATDMYVLFYLGVKWKQTKLKYDNITTFKFQSIKKNCTAYLIASIKEKYQKVPKSKNCIHISI